MLLYLCTECVDTIVECNVNYAHAVMFMLPVSRAVQSSGTETRHTKSALWCCLVGPAHVGTGAWLATDFVSQPWLKHRPVDCLWLKLLPSVPRQRILFQSHLYKSLCPSWISLVWAIPSFLIAELFREMHPCVSICIHYICSLIYSNVSFLSRSCISHQRDCDVFVVLCKHHRRTETRYVQSSVCCGIPLKSNGRPFTRLNFPHCWF